MSDGINTTELQEGLPRQLKQNPGHLTLLAVAHHRVCHSLNEELERGKLPSLWTMPFSRVKNYFFPKPTVPKVDFDKRKFVEELLADIKENKIPEVTLSLMAVEVGVIKLTTL